MKRLLLCTLALLCGAGLGGAQGVGNAAEYTCEAHPLSRNGIPLHLDCTYLAGTRPERSILLLHGSTYSSHIFDVNYGDYSLVRRLAREGYAVWRLDIAGYGRSGRVADGTFDPAVADPVVIDMFCSGCWRYDGESSPNGWRRDAFVDPSQALIDLDAIEAPTLVICGDRDPYMDWAAVGACLDHLPEGSRLEIIPGGSHIVMYEKPCYRAFQEKVIGFLNAGGGDC